jgi:hypothetical protein
MTGQAEHNLHPVYPNQRLTTVDQTNQALQAFRLECFFTVIGLVRKPLHLRPPPNLPCLRRDFGTFHLTIPLQSLRRRFCVFSRSSDGAFRLHPGKSARLSFCMIAQTISLHRSVDPVVSRDLLDLTVVDGGASLTASCRNVQVERYQRSGVLSFLTGQNACT